MRHRDYHQAYILFKTTPNHAKAPMDESEISCYYELYIADGYTTFISGCAMGVDICAGQIVLRKKANNLALHLITATPWPGFVARWKDEWKNQYNDTSHNLVVKRRKR